MEPGVLGFVNHAHAAAAELLDDAVVGEGLADQGIGALWRVVGLVAGERSARPLRSPGAPGSASRLRLRAQQCADFAVPAARRPRRRAGETRRAPRADAPARTGGGYRAVSSDPSPSSVSPVSSRYSQILALLQSRLTVTGETLSTMAVSSTLRPPKKRISTTLHFARIDARQCVQRVIERHEVGAGIDAHENGLIQRDMLHAASAFEVMTSCMLDQNTAHQLRGHREEMGPILPLHPLVIHQAHIGFIDQRGRLEAVAAALTSHVAVRQAAELRIDDRRQLVERELVSVAPGAEQLADVVYRHLARRLYLPSVMDCTRRGRREQGGLPDPGMLLSVAALNPLLGFERILVHCFDLDRHSRSGNGRSCLCSGRPDRRG